MLNIKNVALFSYEMKLLQSGCIEAATESQGSALLHQGMADMNLEFPVSSMLERVSSDGKQW